MLDRGQAKSGMIKTIFVGVILAVVLGMATSQIVSSMPGTSDYKLKVDGVGSDSADFGSYKSVENGTLTIDYDFSTGDGTADNLTVTVNSKVIYDNENIEGTGTVENDVTDEIQEGTNTIDVSLEGDTAHINSLTTKLEATLNTDVLGVIPTAESMGPTIVTFIFLGLLVLAIVGLIRYFRAV